MFWSPHRKDEKQSMTPLTVAIVEDHPEFRDALVSALSASPKLHLLEVCKDLPAGAKLLEGECPDVLLVDLGLPSGSGLTLIRAASRQWGQDCSPAVLTVTGNEEHLLSAVAVGAKGYLFKSDQPSDWVQAVLALGSGHSVLHANLAQRFLEMEPFSEGCSELPDTAIKMLLRHIAAGYTSDEAANKMGISPQKAGLLLRRSYDHLFKRGPELSAREFQMLTLLNKGSSMKDCSELMGVSESTIKTLLKRTYQKLGASNLQTALYEARSFHLVA